MEIASLNLYIVGAEPHTTIQSAVNAAARNPRGSVWIKADYAGTDSYTNPSAVPIYDNRGAGSITLSAPSTTSSQTRIIISGATALASGNFSTPSSNGWGTGATITAIHGSDAAHYYTITAGSSPSSLPTVQLTYADGAWSVAPIADIRMIGGTGSFTDLGVATNTVSYTLTYFGTPLNGLTYIFAAQLIGPVS